MFGDMRLERIKRRWPRKFMKEIQKAEEKWEGPSLR
jgi:hypothetical protein